MKGNLKISALAAAAAMFAMGTASAQGFPHADVETAVATDIAIWGDIEAWGSVEVGGYLNVGGDINIDVDYDYNDSIDRNVVDNRTTNHTENVNVNVNHNEDTSISNSLTQDINLSQDLSLTQDINQTLTEDISLSLTEDISRSLTEDVSLSLDVAESLTVDATETWSLDVTESHNYQTDEQITDIRHNEYSRTDVRSERDEHGVSVNIDKSLSLDSDITFSGDVSLSGDIVVDSAAIALIDNRQSNTGNVGLNDLVTNDASIDGDAGTEASGNLQFNVAAGDNNVQDNAAALSAADADFAFGLADAEIFVNQYGAGNTTVNSGVTNSASMGGNAFSDAAGNIGVNIASGNNNQQKNALAASVATSAYSQASVSSNQISTGNVTSNEGYTQEMTDSVEVSLSGTVSGSTMGVGFGLYEGSSSGTYEGDGGAYQQDNFYLDSWSGALPHASGNPTGHLDMDNSIQNAVENPNRPGVGGIAFDTDEEGTYEGTESGALAFMEMGIADLEASMAGVVSSTQWIVVDHTNTASLSDSAFARASGNIGVNLAAGSGNLQANSLAMAVAQPSANGAPPPVTED